MGWLGWSADETMNADVNAIQMAIEGRHDLLENLFGDPKKKKRKGKSVVTADKFKEFARSHNSSVKRQRKHG